MLLDLDPPSPPPILFHPLGWRESQCPLDSLILRAAHIVNAWEDAPKALAADEAIENGDRNLGIINKLHELFVW
jgi:hypothetical protein